MNASGTIAATPVSIARRKIDEYFKSTAKNFLGSCWSFYELHDGHAFWHPQEREGPGVEQKFGKE